MFICSSVNIVHFNYCNYCDFEQVSVEESMRSKASPVDLFRSKGNLKALIISAGLIIFQQLSGINVVLFYTQDIFRDTGSDLKPEIATIIIGSSKNC